MSKILPMILAAGMTGGSGGGVTIDQVKQITGELENLQTEHKDNLVNAINDLELFKFPNVTIIGDPTINHGQVTDFSDLNYLEFPFLVDFRGRSFEINFNFTTGTDIDNQQNILDSDFGLAFAIKNKHLLIAVSTNGTSWAIAQEGTFQLSPQTTYDIRISWNGLSYKVSYSTDDRISYIDDITFGQSVAPYPKQMFIGIGKLDDNYFTGSINLNKANLKIAGELVWQGMDDVGLATRLATDLSNIDNAGVERIKDIAGGSEFPTLYIPSNFTGTRADITDQTTLDNGTKIINELYKLNNSSAEILIKSTNSNVSFMARLIVSGMNVQSTNYAFWGVHTNSSNVIFTHGASIQGTWTNNEFTCTMVRSHGGTSKNLNAFLSTSNTSAYDVRNDYNPAHKKYVDDAIASAITTTLEGEY